MSPALPDDFFRHEYSKLVASLVRRFGTRNVEAVEDAVQFALMTGLETWRGGELPSNPSAWLSRVAQNKVVEDLRTAANQRRLEPGEPYDPSDFGANAASAEYVDLLRMLFYCCDERLPTESQLVMALRYLCGFDVREIALRLFLSEANVYKRLGRGRERLRQLADPAPDLRIEDHAARVEAVRTVLYLLFSEGYASHHAEFALRNELCREAIRLATLLAEHPIGRSPQTYALLALMHLHSARMDARLDSAGGLLLLEEQDRSLWDPFKIQRGLEWLEKSASGDEFSRYHAEAGVAAEHCLAGSLEETRWEKVVEYYELLEQDRRSAIHTLNRAVAVAEWKGPEAGLAVLEGMDPPTWLSGSYVWSAVLADLHARCGHDTRAARYRKIALETAPTPQLKALLRRRLSDRSERSK